MAFLGIRGVVSIRKLSFWIYQQFIPLRMLKTQSACYKIKTSANSLLIKRCQGTRAAHCRAFQGSAIELRRCEREAPFHRCTWTAFSDPFPNTLSLEDILGQRDTLQPSKTYRSATEILLFQARLPRPCVA